jgi:hypothetical protein
MAQQVIYLDDLDLSVGARTITFALEGKEYEIDLSEKNSERLRSGLQEFIDAARPVERRSASLPPERTTRRRGGGNSRDDLAEIRAWAQAEGKDVSARGRIKQTIIDEYDEAHK